VRSFTRSNITDHDARLNVVHSKDIKVTLFVDDDADANGSLCEKTYNTSDPTTTDLHSFG